MSTLYAKFEKVVGNLSTLFTPYSPSFTSGKRFSRIAEQEKREQGNSSQFERKRDRDNIKSQSNKATINNVRIYQGQLCNDTIAERNLNTWTKEAETKRLRKDGGDRHRTLKVFFLIILFV